MSLDRCDYESPKTAHGVSTEDMHFLGGDGFVRLNNQLRKFYATEIADYIDEFEMFMTADGGQEELDFFDLNDKVVVYVTYSEKSLTAEFLRNLIDFEFFWGLEIVDGRNTIVFVKNK